MMGTVTVFRTPDEAALELELPLLGVIPVPPDAKGPFCPSAPRDPDVAKAYGRALERVLRPTEPKGSIGVIGDVDPSQRAFVSGAIAASLAAQRGAVLVDADLRAANLSFDSGSRAQEGLVDVLRYGVRSPRVLAPTSTPGLDLLPVGSATVDLFGTYGSDAAAPLFEELRRGGFLVVNGPGPSDVDAAAPLLRRVASWILLVEIGRSDAEVTRRLRDAMGRGRCAGVLAAAARVQAAAPAPAPKPAAAPPPPPAPAPPVAAAAPPPLPPRPAAENPPPARRTPTRDLPAAAAPPPPLPPVAVRPVKNVTPARSTARPEIKDRTGGIAADPKSGRRILWWIGGAALVSVAIAVTLLRPQGDSSRPAAPAPSPAATAPAPVPRAEHPVAVQPPPAVAEATGETESAPVETGTADAGGAEIAAAPDASAPDAAAPDASAPAGTPQETVTESAPPPAEESSPPVEETVAAAPPPAEETPPARRAAPPPAAAAQDLFARTVPLVAGQNVWAVHVSSFQTHAPAQQESARFVAAGFPTVFHSVEVSGKGHWIRIYVGPFADRATAEEAAGRIRAGIQEYTMVRRLPAGELQDGTGREGR